MELPHTDCNILYKNLVIGRLPFDEDIQKIVDNFDVIINLTQELDYTQKKVDIAHPFTIIHLPIEDYGIPDGSEIKPYEELIISLVNSLSRDERIYLHCRAGIGRAGTLGAIVYGIYHDIPADEAIEVVDKSMKTRDNDRFKDYNSPMTSVQVRFVDDMIYKFTGKRAKNLPSRKT